ncbi:S-layer homology domain-containing protein, partial [bacterium]|nr:S-layer homology domain-containing protein [bacterium]
MTFYFYSTKDMNIKKMFTTLSAMVVAVMFTLPNASVFAATYSQELTDAYNWAYSKGVTTMSPIDNANMYGAITRSEMAKMLSVYATEVLGMTPDTSAACTFSDIDSVKGDLHDYIIESCQLGIMGQGITAFRPYDTISRAEFGTALSRVLWGSQYEGGTPYYAKHLDALKSAGIMNQIANAESTKEIRGYVMLMLMRSEGN